MQRTEPGCRAGCRRGVRTPTLHRPPVPRPRCSLQFHASVHRSQHFTCILGGHLGGPYPANMCVRVQRRQGSLKESLQVPAELRPWGGEGLRVSRGLASCPGTEPVSWQERRLQTGPGAFPTGSGIICSFDACLSMSRWPECLLAEAIL